MEQDQQKQVGAKAQEQQKEPTSNKNYLGSAIQTFPDEPKFLLNMVASKLEAAEEDQFGKIKIDLVGFTKDGKISFGVYLHDDSRKMSNVHLILQIDKEKTLSFENEKGYIPLTTNNKNPENIRADKMNIVVYHNKYSEEMKVWTKEERNSALRPNPEDYVGGGWKVDRSFHRGRETKEKEILLKQKEQQQKTPLKKKNKEKV